MDSRSDSLAIRLKRLDLFDEYFSWWLQERPSFADRQEWLDKHECSASAGALHRLHRSPEAAQWRTAEAAKARAVMDANLPKDIDTTIRKALLDQRFNAVMGELSHKELMEFSSWEADAERLRLEREKLAIKKSDKTKDNALSSLRLQLMKSRQQLAKIADEGLTDANKDGVAALLSELEALGVK